MHEGVNCLSWYAANIGKPDAEKICSTRDVFLARLSHLLTALDKNQFSGNESSLIIAAIGEVGNNTFDHNLGRWQDIPGCWFEYAIHHKELVCWLADRGCGMLSTLENLHIGVKSEQEAIDVAYTLKISGRHPEKRGNGLKFVRHIFEGNTQRVLLAKSGEGQIILGEKIFLIDTLEKIKTSCGKGVITLLKWIKNEN